MQELDDNALLREYVERASERAFAAIVQRHLNKVYSVSLRQTRNPHSAEEITQAVFVILARKAPSLSKSVVLSGWLYETARLTSLTFVRSEIRRARREEEAYMQSLANDSGAWSQIAPELDAAMGGLSAKDRDAVVLRFFDGKSMREVGASLGANEATARQRVSRAVEKLRSILTKKGIVLSSTILTAAISANSVQAAPSVLATSVSALAISKGMAVGGSTLTLVKGALKTIAWTKATMALAIGASLLFVAGTTTIIVKEWQLDIGAEQYFRKISSTPLQEIPPYFIVRPTRYNSINRGTTAVGTSTRSLGKNASMQIMIQYAYYFHNQTRTIFPAQGFPSGGFDFLVTIPDGMKKFQEEIKNQFGYHAHKEMRNVDALVLRVSNPNAPGLKANKRYSQGDRFFIDWSGLPISSLVDQIESRLEIPVVDQTGLKGDYAVRLDWEESSSDKAKAELRRAVLDQLGLELVPTNMPIEIFVVEKVK